MKKSLSLLLLASVFAGVVLLAGCGGGKGEPATPTSPPGDAMKQYQKSNSEKKPGGN